MIFQLKADCIITANDISDAFRKLQLHFLAVSNGVNSKIIEIGSITIESIEDKERKIYESK